MNTRHHSVGRIIGRMLAAVGILLASACSDGGGTFTPEPTPSLTKPSIDNFDITSATDETNTSEDGILVPSGAGVTLTWRTSNAETVELESASGTIEAAKVEAAGSTEIANVTQDDAFILIARAGGVETRKTVTVTITAPKPPASVVSFTADPTSVTVGETTQLCFTVKPSDATVAIVDVATGDEITLEDEPPLGDDMIEDEAVEEEEAPSADSAISAMTKLSIAAATVAPEEDGGTVTPELDPTPTPEDDETPAIVPEDTDAKTGCSMPLPLAMGEHTFELTVTDSEDNTATAETTVTVEQAVRVVEFTVNGGPSTTVNVGDPISFAYTIDPVDATVTIEPGFGPVTVDASGKGTVTSKAETPGSTTYTLTATDATGTATDKKTVTVTVSQGSAVTAPKLTVSTKAVFAGESVTFTVSDVAQGMTVSLKHPDGKMTPISGSSKIGVTVGGAYQVVGAINNAEVYSNAETIDVRAWGNAKGGAGSWTSVTVDTASGQIGAGSAGGAVVGLSANGDEWNTLSIAGAPNAKGESKNFSQLFEGITSIPAAMQKQFGPYPVHAVAFDATQDSGGRIFAGMAGGLMMSQDGGKYWTAVDHMVIYDFEGRFKDTAESHKSCKGLVQQGITRGSVEVVSIQNVCDLAIDATSSRLVAAMDGGVFYADDINALASGKAMWEGLPHAGETMDAAGDVYGLVVNDIEFSGGTLYAATSHGVHMSTQGGAEGSWQEYSGGVLGDYSLATRTGSASDVYAVAVDATKSRAYAGTASGDIAVRSTTGDVGAWTSKKSVGAPVYSLSVDYSTGDVLAGTGAGVFISRDQGETWTDISASMDTKVVYGVALQSGVFAAATDKGVYISRPGKTVEAPVVDDEPTVAPTAPPEGSAAETNAAIL